MLSVERIYQFARWILSAVALALALAKTSTAVVASGKMASVLVIWPATVLGWVAGGMASMLEMVLC
jgi:hypothetical protein